MPQNQSYKSQQDKIKEATEKLEAGIRDFLSSDKYQDYLKVMSRFHNYSYSNSVLIALQKPDASLVAGYTTWDRKFERHPKKGSRGIRIFAPAPVKTNTYIEREKLDPDTKLPVLDESGNPVMESVAIKRPAFKVVSVFDVSDTEGKPMPELDIVHPLSGDVTQFDSFLEAIRRTADVPIAFEKIESGANGYYSLTDKRIAINEGTSELQTIKTAIHELAHSRLHDIDTTLPPNKQPVQKDKATKEVEAESIAFVVSEHFGLDTSDYSFGYVGTWSSGKELPELKSSLQTIRDAANSIITEMESHLLEIQQERQTEQTVEQESAQSAPERNAAQTVELIAAQAEDSVENDAISTPAEQEAVETYEEVEVFGIPMLFSNGRVRDDELPDGMFRYDLRGSDDDPGNPITIEKNVVVNHAATVLSAVEIDLTAENRLMLGEGLNFLGGESTIAEYQEYMAGMDANALRAEMNEFIAAEKAEAWHYYIIPDLMTWAQPNGEKPETPREHFDNFEDAVARFRELRQQPYNLEKTERPDTHIPYARLTFGIQQGNSDNNLASLLYVQNGKNVLVDDFTRMPALKDSPEVMKTLSRLGTEIGFQQVLVHRGMTPKEVQDFTYSSLADRLQKSSLPEKQQQEYLSGFDAAYSSGKLDALLPSTGEQIITELRVFSEWENPYFTVEDTPERLAMDIDTLSLDYEASYGLDSTTSLYHETLASIQSGDVDSIRTYLNTLAGKESEFSANASVLLQRLSDMVPEAEIELQTVAPEEVAYQIGSRYLHMQVASDGSWDYSVYDRNLNLTDGGQIGDGSTSFLVARNGLLEEYYFPKNEPLTGIAPEHFAEMLDKHENDLKCPICPLSLPEAREQGKLDDWRISHNANEACAKQFSKEYTPAYHDHRVPEFLSQMADRYGIERCKLVLAATIQLSPWDKRYHPPIREAANQIVIPGASADPDHDARLRYRVSSHPVMVDVAFRDLMEMEKEQSREAEKSATAKNASTNISDKPLAKQERPSVLKKLKSKQQALAAAGNTPKPPDRDKPQL